MKLKSDMAFTQKDLEELEKLEINLNGSMEEILVSQMEVHEKLKNAFPRIAEELKRLWSEEERLKWLDPEMFHGEDSEGRCALCHSEEGQECAFCIEADKPIDPNPGVGHSVDVNGFCNKGCC